MSLLRRVATLAVTAVVVAGGLVVVQASPAFAVFPCKLDRKVDFNTDRAGLSTVVWNGGICSAAGVRHYYQPPSGSALWTQWVGYNGTAYTGERWSPQERQLVKGQTCRGTYIPGNCWLDSTFTNTSWARVG